MIKLYDIYYCPKCHHKMIWEQVFNTRGYFDRPYSMLVDTYKPEILEFNAKIVKLRFACRKCKNVEVIDYNYNTCTFDIH